MIALPFHPSNVVSIHDFQQDPLHYLEKIQEEADSIRGETKAVENFSMNLTESGFVVDQGMISGCSGGIFEEIAATADIFDSLGREGACYLGFNPASQAVNMQLLESGVSQRLMKHGFSISPAFCGPCFGVPDIPSNGSFSIRHVTQKYPNREGSKPDQEQIAAVALMDGRSIAATIAKGGLLTAATDVEVDYHVYQVSFTNEVYDHSVLDFRNAADKI